MIKTLAKSIREYKLPSILTLIFIMGEVLIEVAIPLKNSHAKITMPHKFCFVGNAIIVSISAMVLTDNTISLTIFRLLYEKRFTK